MGLHQIQMHRLSKRKQEGLGDTVSFVKQSEKVPLHSPMPHHRWGSLGLQDTGAWDPGCLWWGSDFAVQWKCTEQKPQWQCCMLCPLHWEASPMSHTPVLSVPLIFMEVAWPQGSSSSPFSLLQVLVPSPWEDTAGPHSPTLPCPHLPTFPWPVHYYGDAALVLENDLEVELPLDPLKSLRHLVIGLFNILL